MIMSRDQNAGRSHSMKTDNSSIERMEEFKYLGTALTNKNSIQEEIKIRLKSGNACYYSVQNLLSSSLLSKNLKVKIYRTIILLRCKYNSDKICASKCLPVDSICYLQKHLNAFVHINFVLAVIKKCAN